ncbi:MAG: DNA gyrase subunit A [Kiritimatiellia bacterium]
MDQEVPDTNHPIDTRLAAINIEDEMSNSYIDYSMSVIVGRALPDVRDGLKPVHRRVLYAMHELNNVYNQNYKKAARVVGDVIGKYHPHGDTAVYDTIVRLAQDFSMRYPLVDGQGNFGSIDGDPPAAMRYTEVRMAKIANEMLADIDKETVDFQPNYNDEFLEPRVLPAKLPNLLLNGSSGIAVGMATNIPPHNLAELVDGCIHLIDHPGCSIDELMQFVKGPDFPTGATICGRRGIEAMYKLGRGAMMIRGTAEIVENKRGGESIIITSLPYMVNKAELVKKIVELHADKVVEGIADVTDQSKDDIRIVIDLKRNAIAQVVLNNLYRHTQLQTTFGANLLAIDAGRPKLMNLKEILWAFLNHRFDVITRRCRFELNKALARCHILEGYLGALDHIDEVIALIRSSQDRSAARTALQERFGFSEIQANAILELQLHRLTNMAREDVQGEHAQLQQTIASLRARLSDQSLIYADIKADLAALKTDYAKLNPRRTELVPLENEVSIEDLIADEPCVITLSHRGYVKRVPLSVYREQRRGGKGVTGAAIKEEDFIEQLFVAETHDTLLLFTTLGRVYAKRAFEIEEASRTSFGRPIVNILELREGESVAAMLSIRAFAEDTDILFATRNGTVKKTALADYRNVNRNGINALNIEAGDQLIQVRLVSAGDEVLLLTAHGKAVRFDEDQVRRMGRNATGVRGVSLSEGDFVCACDVAQADSQILLATENGYGLRCALGDFRKTKRGAGGVRSIDTGERNGLLVAAHRVEQTDSMVMITSSGKMVRSPVDQVRIINRGGKGVILLKMEPGEKLVSLSLAEGEADDLPDSNAPAAPADASDTPPKEPTPEPPSNETL